MARSFWVGTLVGMLACTAPAWAQVQGQERTVTIKEADKPAQKCRVLKCWREKDGSKVCQVQAIDGGEIMTILEPVAAPQVSAGGTTGRASRIFHWGDKSTPPSEAPVAPADAVVLGKPTSQQSLFSRLFGTKDKPAVKSDSSCKECAAKKECETCKESEVARTSGEPPPARDWQLSWGKVERWTDNDSKKAVAEAKTRSEQSSRPDLPLAQSAASDPIAHPEIYAKFPQAPGSTAQTAPVSRVEAEPATPVTATPVTAAPVAAAPAPASQGRRSLASWWQGRTGTSSAASTHVAAEDSDMPPGLGSVVAAELGGPGEPVQSANRSPAKFAAPMPSVPVGAPNAFTLSMPGAGQGMSGSMMNSAGVAQMTVPDGLGNAFTTPTTSRPTPGEFDVMQPSPSALAGLNGFQNGGGMGGAYQRPALVRNAGYYPPPPMIQPISTVTYTPPVAVTGTLLNVLHNAMLPSDRELAAVELGKHDWKQQPEVVQGLMYAAVQDPAPTVRAGCVHALGKMNANTLPVVQTVTALKNDKDVRVRQEAEQALSVLTGQ